MRARTFFVSAILVPLLVAAYPASVRAQIRVEGSEADVRLEARDATVADVLAALAQRFGLRVRGTVADRHLSANFDGPLRRVIARVLDGYNYVIQTRGDGLEVMVLSTASPKAVVAPTIPPPTYPSKSTRRNE